jgi:zinc protease
MANESSLAALRRPWLRAVALVLGAACAPHAPAGTAPAAEPRAVASASPGVDIPRIAVERYTLDNGLTVLLSVDRSAPVVAVDLWYHVGSKNERPGRTGFAHLFEHVMFEGSQHIPDGDHLRLVEEAGGDINGTTSLDRTNFYDVVPINELETVLWLESDRMGFLLPALTQAKLDGQREVVKNERRERYEQPPFGVEPVVLSAAIYPSGHPYSWPTIGSMADLSAASLDDVKDFFRQYYGPNNATLTIVGDIDVAATKALVQKYFGPIPRGPQVARPAVRPATLAAEKRLVLEDANSRLPKLTIAWPTVGRDSADSYALNALSEVLTQDRTSRLTKALVYERQLATGVSAFQGSDHFAGEFYISITPRAGSSLTEIESVVDSIVATLVTAPPTDREVQRFKNYVAVGAVTGLQSVLGKAETLSDGQTFFGDPLHYIAEARGDLAVTPADVHRVARRFLTAGRVVLSMVPAGKLDLISKPGLPYSNVTPTIVP